MTILQIIRGRAILARNVAKVWVLSGILVSAVGLFLLPLWFQTMDDSAVLNTATRSVKENSAQPSNGAMLIAVSTSVALRLVPAALVIYLVVTAFQCAQYQTKLADHLEVVADAVCLAGDNINDLHELVATMQPQRSKDSEKMLKGLESVLRSVEKATPRL
jgi:hypothetical protein